jgi:hypothetical protein
MTTLTPGRYRNADSDRTVLSKNICESRSLAATKKYWIASDHEKILVWVS